MDRGRVVDQRLDAVPLQVPLKLVTLVGLDDVRLEDAILVLPFIRITGI